MADSFSSSLRLDEEIFEENSRLCEKRGIVVEEQGESYRLVLNARYQDLSGWMLAEKRSSKAFFSGDTLVTQSLVFREGLDELKNKRQVAFDCRSDADFLFRSGHDVIIDLARESVNGILHFVDMNPYSNRVN